MGSIAVQLSRKAPPSPDAVQQMLSAAPHRGTRLSIERLGRVVMGASNDPDWVTAGVARRDSLLVAFYGALDNRAELLAQLPDPEEIATHGSTAAAILLAAYERWGTGAVARLRGSFAGAISDGAQVWCFRDHFGSRPLFHHDGADGFFLASEVKQVLAGSGLRREPNLPHLHGVIFGGIDRTTAYLGVERIPKATLVRVGDAPGLSEQIYWDPSDYVETRRLSQAEAVEATVEALDRAVRRQLTGADALLLSGGLDSPALAVFAARANGLPRPVQAVTSLYPAYPSVDEREWTEMAAEHVGMPLHAFVAEAGSLDEVEKWVKLVDGPVDLISIPEAVEAYRFARSLGARTVMNGEVAEFLFECRGFLLDHLASRGRWRAAARHLGWRRERGRSYRQLARETVRAIAPAWLLTLRHRRRPIRLRAVPEWLDEARFFGLSPSRPMWIDGPRQRWRRLQAAPLRGPGIGFEVDEICGAICGVDPRRPFADVDLWELVLSFPAEVKFTSPRTKPLLRDAMRGLLPDALIDRKDKTVFNEFHEAKADYPTLKGLLVDSRHRLDGVDYEGLRLRLDAGDMHARELQWARDVARIHAFLNQW